MLFSLWCLSLIGIPNQQNTGALAGEDWGKKVIEYLSILHILGNELSCFLAERAYIFSRLTFITNVPIEAFLVALDVPGQS